MIRRGLFAVYKPPGITSAEVTNRLKILLSDKGSHGTIFHSSPSKLKIGHGGTLDKFAEGVLVIGVGKDCKKLGHFQKNVTKSYNVIGRLGVTTNSLDPNGTETERKEWKHITEDSLRASLEEFHGNITQSVPLFSAVKYKGKRLSDYARESIDFNIHPPQKQVHIHSLSLLDFTPPDFHIGVTCSSGTYMRSLVRDIAKRLNTVGYVVSLCRTMQGQFTLDHAIRPSEEGKWSVQSIMSAMETSISVTKNDAAQQQVYVVQR